MPQDSLHNIDTIELILWIILEVVKMDNDKTERLQIALDKALKPIIERLDRIEKEIQALKESNK